MMENLKSKKILLIISFIIAIIFLFTSISFALYRTADFADDFWKYKDTDANSLLGKTFAADRDFDEPNLLCIGGPDGTGAGPYNSSHRLVGIIDINYDGPNTVTLYKEGKSPIKLNQKNSTDIQWFNAIAKAVAQSSGYGTDNEYGAAFSKIMDQNLKGRFKYILGTNPVPSVSWSISSDRINYVSECETHGQSVLNNAIDDTFKKSDNYKAEEASCESVNASSNDVYIGPFKYNYKNKVNFGSIEITGKNGEEVVYNEKITNVNKDRLFVKDGSQYKGVDFVNSETPFYIKANKKADEAGNIEVKITAKDVSYYKSRIGILKSEGVPSQNLVVYSGSGQPKTEGKQIIFKFENNKGNLEINKSGIASGKAVNKVENMGYKVYYLNNNKKQYLKLITDTKTMLKGDITVKRQEVTTNSNDATIIYTDQNGQARLKGIDSRYQYYLEEVTDKSTFSNNILKATQKLATSGAQETEVPLVEKGVVGPITVKKKRESEQTTVKIEDAKKTGNLHIVKEDYDKTGKKVSGVKFKVQNADTKQWVKAEGSNGVYNLKTYDKDYSKNKEYYKYNYTSNENEATEFETNSNGEITINGVDIGKYILKEVYINNNNGAINYGYTEVDKPSNVDKNYVFWSTDGGKTKNSLAKKDIQLTVEPSDKTAKSTIYVYNKKKYVKITGFVWEDIRGGKDNSYEYEGNGKDTYAKDDILVDGITVRLKDKNGNIVKTETTKNGGAYTFLEVSREAIENGDYYVEFEYNGLTYTSVLTLVGNDSSINSKAGEVVDQRKKLNSAFTEITNKDDINDRSHGYSRDGSVSVTGTLTYKNELDKWQSIYEGTTYNNETYSGVNLTANTNVSGYSLEKEFKEGRFTVDSNDAFVIEHVNLGMRKRKQPQISISNDIESAEVKVNGYDHTYKYAQRNTAEKDWSKSPFNVGVKFEKQYAEGTYNRAIYPSDIEYSKSADNDNKLKVYITYATTIRNMSNGLQMSVNELANYYDSRYTIVDSWIGENDEDRVEVKWSDTSKYGQKYENENYKGAYTTSLAGTKINAEENLKVYIKFQVSDSAVLGLLNGTATLHNASEIFSYSTYYGSDIEGCKTGDIYAGIDRASAPGNAKPGDKSTYEADTDDAPSLLLEAKGVREIEGTVFEDKPVFEDKKADELHSGEKRLGDGMYQEKQEGTVGGVKVELVKASNGEIAKVYPPKDIAKDGQEVVDTTEGGVDAIAYTHGGEDSKTLVKNDGLTGKDGYYIIKGIEPDEYLIKYTYANGTTKLYTTDGKEVNVTVQDYKSTIITSDVIKEAFKDIKKADSWYKTEVEKRYSDARDDYKTRNGYDQINPDGVVEQQTGIDEQIETIDSKTEAKEDLIKSLEAKSPNLKIRVEYEDNELKTDSEYGVDRYTVKISNLDFGIVERPRQSATLGKEVAYLKVTLPNGQVLIDGDPRDKDKPLDYVTVTRDKDGKVEEIYITIDTELLYGSQVEIKYDFTLTNTSELDYRNESYYYYGDSKENPVKFTSATLIDYVDSDITLKAGQEGTWKALDIAEKGFNWNLTKEQEEQILKNYSTLVKAEPISRETAIAAGESKTTAIYVEKLLANSDELTYENNGEVVKISKTGGSTMTTTLGSYATVLAADINAEPEVIDGLIETDEAKAEPVTIIPPTGSTDNTITYAIIGATSLVALAAGIFGIRKFLKK